MLFWLRFVNKVFISNTKVLSTKKTSKKYIPSWNKRSKGAIEKDIYI